MSFEEQQEAVWRVALASYDPREMRVWMRYLEECNPAIRCTGYRTSQTLLRRLEQGDVDVLVLGGRLECWAAGSRMWTASSSCPGCGVWPASLWFFCGTTDGMRRPPWRA